MSAHIAVARVEIEKAKAVRAPLPGPSGLEDTLSPVDLPPSDAPLPDPLSWTTTVIAVATLFLTLFNAHALRSWAYALDSNAVSERIVEASERWYAATGSVGLNGPVETMRAEWQKVKDARFGSEAAPR
jgi:hypothetical protein